MDKLKRFIDLYIPTETCNLRCSYCYITLQRKFVNKIAKFPQTTDEIQKAFSKERLGGACLFNICAGGETLLAEDMVRVLKVLLEEGHYLMVVTNGMLTKRHKEIAQFNPSLLKRLFFKFSFHYLELLKRNRMDKFFDNVKMMEDAGCSYTVELTPHDELIPHIQDIKQTCLDRMGTLCHLTIGRDDRTKEIKVLSEHSFEDYKKIWGSFNSEFFDFKATIFNQKRKEFCYAGDWSLYINAYTGNIQQCYGTQIIGNIYDIKKPIEFKAVGHNCHLAHCYNGHAFLTLGNIPSLKTPTFATMRDKNPQNRRNWLTEQYRDFISQKLEDNNEQYPQEVQDRSKRYRNINIIKNYASRAKIKFQKILDDRK